MASGVATGAAARADLQASKDHLSWPGYPSQTGALYRAVWMETAEATGRAACPSWIAM